MKLPGIGQVLRRLLTFYGVVVVSLVAIIVVSLVMVLPAHVLGPKDMDITFDIRESAAAGGVRDGSAVYGRNDELGIECSDASRDMGDGKWWIRCRYVAEEISYATDYLRTNGLEIGHTYARIVIQPAGGSWINLACGALIVACLVLIWSWGDRLRLRRDVAWIVQNRARSMLAVIAPGLATVAALALATWIFGESPAAQPPPIRREYLLSLFMTIVVIAPVVEEFLYRGVIYDLLCKRSSPWVAAGVATALFVGAHVGTEFWKIDAVRVTALTVGSLALFAVRIRSGSLLLCIAGHALLNLLVFYVYSRTAIA